MNAPFPLLDVQSLQVNYGQVQVLFNLTIQVYNGEIVTIIGPNGAGKSTLIKAIIGLSSAQAGNIIFNNQNITRLPTHRIPPLGIGYVPQGRIVFAGMTVMENLALGAFLITNKLQRRAAIARVFAQFSQLEQRSKVLAGQLSGGEQQMLAIGRALMLDPKLIILDKPSLGLSPKYVDLVFNSLLTLKQQGRTLLMVEQNAARALSFADRGYALELGRNRFTGTGQELLHNQEVRRMYLGGV